MTGRLSQVLLLGAFVALAAIAENDRLAPGEPHETNLSVGDFPPVGFELAAAADGALFDLEARRGEHPILLLFFRGTW